MLGKLSYYARRTAETPLRSVIAILWQRTKPFVVWPLYVIARVARPAWSSANGDALIAFGASLAEALRLRGVVRPEFAEQARARARHALHGQFPCLGYGEQPVPSGSLWHRDRFHDFDWPLVYFARVDFLSESERCDVKVPWEFSRLQILIWLAEGAIFDPDAFVQYRTRFETIVTDWIASNPSGYGVNWSCAMEVAIRGINLSLATSVFLDSLDQNLKSRIVRCLAGHNRFLDRFPEKSDVSGNHYLANLAGGVFLKTLLRGAGAARAAKSICNFADEASRQFEEEGCHIERAPVYHRLCLELVALVTALAVRSDSPVADKLRHILVNGVAFCDAIESSGQILPILGDSDSGQVIYLGNDARRYSALKQFSSLLETQAIAISDDGTDWLAALANREPSPSSSQVAEIAAVDTMERSGFLSARNGGLVAVMRVGAQGLKGRAPHDHDDALSLWISKDGRDVVTEEGCHSYTLDPAIRARNIASPAHNVVQPAGRRRYELVQGSIFKTVRGAPTAFDWSHSLEDGSPGLEASLATPEREGQPFKACRRKVELASPDVLIVQDDWVWREPLDAELFWHLGPELDAQPRPDGVLAVVDESGLTVMTLTVQASSSAAIDTFHYNYSPVYGSVRKCVCVRVSVPKCKAGAVTSTFAFSVAS